MKLIPWEEVAVQLDADERSLFEVAFAGAKDRFHIEELRIYGRRYIVAPSGKVWLVSGEPLLGKRGSVQGHKQK